MKKTYEKPLLHIKRMDPDEILTIISQSKDTTPEQSEAKEDFTGEDESAPKHYSYNVWSQWDDPDVEE